MTLQVIAITDTIFFFKCRSWNTNAFNRRHLAQKVSCLATALSCIKADLILCTSLLCVEAELPSRCSARVLDPLGHRMRDCVAYCLNLVCRLVNLCRSLGSGSMSTTSDEDEAVVEDIVTDKDARFFSTRCDCSQKNGRSSCESSDRFSSLCVIAQTPTVAHFGSISIWSTSRILISPCCFVCSQALSLFCLWLCLFCT